MSDGGVSVHQSMLDRMRASRGSPAILKLKLAALRSRQPTVVVLGFEGVDDKTIYSQWIGRVRGNLAYEPLPCDGKGGVLSLMDVVSRDATGIGANVYGFVDRDFDDLRSRPPNPLLFMTTSYSPENLLVSRHVLSALLTNEFHCHGSPAVREAICDAFEATYNAFLGVVKAVNFRLFAARKLGIKLENTLPPKLNHRLSITVDSVADAGLIAEEIVRYSVMPDAAKLSELAAEFEQLDPSERYRGHWALAFFEQWLRLLVIEYKKPVALLFAGIERANNVREAELVRSNFASKSLMPPGFVEFIGAIAG